MSMPTSKLSDVDAEHFDQSWSNLQRIRERIEQAALRSGRTGDAIRLICVSKTIPATRVHRFLQASRGSEALWLGENRVQEGVAKATAICCLDKSHDVRWSMIGHLQTNKVKDVLAFASEVQSVDRLSVALELERRLQSQGRGIDILVQVNTSGEDSKFGLPSGDVRTFLQELTHLGSLHVRGFMTIAMPSQDVDPIRACFRDLRLLGQKMMNDAPQGSSLIELSMGMSGDFEVAIEEGATTVRIGQAIFGARSKRLSDENPEEDAAVH